MESLDTTAAATSCFMDDLLDFSSDIGEEEDDDDIIAGKSNSHHLFRNRRQPPFSLLSGTQDFVEEELEWISNKDAFPMVESLVDIMPNHPSIAPNSNNSLNSYQSPISVLENSSGSFNSHGSINNIGGNMNMNLMLVNFKVPGKARSKQGRKRRRDLLGHQFLCWSVHGKPAKKHGSFPKSSSTIGRKCLHCGAEKTPQWRAGPLGPKTLCNACGVRYKSGRLCDEYRPASSPTFSSELHSNSHRKIVEMRKQKVPGGSMLKPEIS